MSAVTDPQREGVVAEVERLRGMSLSRLAIQARTNSERWFPLVHDEHQQAVPLSVHYALGLVGEAGEVANLVKKALRKGDADDIEGLGDELADVFTYLILLADEQGVDLMAAFEAKQAICEQRWGK